MELESKIDHNHDQNWFKEIKVSDLMVDKRRLVEVPYTASLAHTMNALVANQVGSVPVAAPPGHWIGAGGSMILESDKQTGAVRKHYIGMVTMFDVLIHIAEDKTTGGGGGGDCLDLDKRLSVRVSSIIGHSLEGLSLWTMNPTTSILDCMEVFSKGIHRALIPLDSHMKNISGVELAESSSSYRMLTQMDVLRFLKTYQSKLKNVIQHTVGELGAITEDVFAVNNNIKVIEAIKCMRTASLNAVPIVEALDGTDCDHTQLLNGKGRKLIGTFSATDLRRCPTSLLQSLLHVSVLEFTEKTANGPMKTDGDVGQASRELVSCFANSSLAEVIDRAVGGHVHRVWVVNQHNLLIGIVSLTDMLRVMRSSLLATGVK
ncbi:Snf1-related protein kinase regulatory subunit gamma-like pv42a [Thalictrum thalictroides]|uniref:Snf1-related protein kinase regulatory subunit gamma-like pv42a n=1 Tax=Thalictrum thalictroides TaxID=46969 RepID=A0A7J6V611_THATH|nr:Snf1-related protein kinase regulatory subunit gamma-like pv42a [Thalictrum thalictroides]